MIWVSMCFNAHARVNTLQPMILFGMLSQLLLWKVWNICLKKDSHLFICHTQWQVDILIIGDNFQTLASIVIVDSTCPNIVQRASSMTMHVVIVAIQEKV